MRHFCLGRSSGTSLSVLKHFSTKACFQALPFPSVERAFKQTTLAALSKSAVVGLALTWGSGAGAQGVVSIGQAAQSAQTGDVTLEFVDAVRRALVTNPEIILEVLSVLESEQAEQEAGKDADLIARHAQDLFAGLDLTKPILLEFQDYNCGYCRRAHSDVTAIREAIPDLQLVVLEFPILGEESRYTAEMALAVKAVYGEGAYRDFVDSVMLADSRANPATVLRVLDILGLDGTAVTRASQSLDIKSELDRAAYLARTMGVRGTPTFIGPSGVSRGAASRAQLVALAQPPAFNTSGKGE